MKRFIDILRNFVLLCIAIPMINLFCLFIFVDWMLYGNTKNKLLNFIDDYFDKKLDEIVIAIQESEHFIVISGPEDEEEEF